MSQTTTQLQQQILAARHQLLELRRDGVGWGYGHSGSPYTEPTVVGALALLSIGDLLSAQGAGHDHLSQETRQLVDQSATWLESLQQPDGSIGIAAAMPAPRWPTAFAVLLWSQLPDYQRSRAEALRWLQLREGHTFVKTKQCVLGHDTSIPGWPWVEGTHPWLEPTAMAMLALCKNQLAGHQRIRDGVRMVLDRSIASGGWNVGNSSAFGRELRPQAGSTGLALLALRAAGHEETPSVTRGCHYLAEALPATRSPETLGWGLLGWEAWRVRRAETETWLSEAFENTIALRHAPMRLSLLLLAAASCWTLPRLGVKTVAPATTASQEIAVP